MKRTTYRARRADYGRVTQSVAEFASALANDSMRPAERGERLMRARELRAKGLETLTAAVLLERAEGASWSDIAHALGMDEAMVRHRWEQFEDELNADLPRIVTS